MKIKEEAKELEALLQTPVTNQTPTQSQPIDDTPEELEPEPLFDFDYAKCKKGYIKKAKNSIKKIVRVVIPDPNMIDYSFIADKIDQDANQLGFLYYQEAKTEVMQDANMKTVQAGNPSPRMFETFSILTKTLTDLSKQISDFEISIKENYAKIKFDAIEEQEFNAPMNTPTLPKNQQTDMEKQGIFIGTAAINKSIQEKKKQILLAKAEEAKFEEVKDEPNNKENETKGEIKKDD